MKQVDKDLEVASLKKLAENYKKRRKSRNRQIVYFELEPGNFCCDKLQSEFKQGNNSIVIEYLDYKNGKYMVCIKDSECRRNHCPYCLTHIDNFFIVQEY